MSSHHAADLSTARRPAKLSKGSGLQNPSPTQHLQSRLRCSIPPDSGRCSWNLKASMVSHVSLELPVSAAASSKRLTCVSPLWLLVENCRSIFALRASWSRAQCHGIRLRQGRHQVPGGQRPSAPRRPNMKDRGRVSFTTPLEFSLRGGRCRRSKPMLGFFNSFFALTLQALGWQEPKDGNPRRPVLQLLEP